MNTRVLWLAVVEKAVSDFRERRLSLIYFYSRDFKIVCHLAELNYDAALERLVEIADKMCRRDALCQA